MNLSDKEYTKRYKDYWAYAIVLGIERLNKCDPDTDRYEKAKQDLVELFTRVI